MTFAGFDPDALAVLADLPDQGPDEYEQHKDALRSGVTQPGVALITEVAARLDADLTVVPRSSVSPLHRDLRFAPEGSPRYKDHLLLTTWEGPSKKSSPVLWIRVERARAGFASGIGFTPQVRDRWRAAVGGDEGARLSDAIDEVVASHDAEVAGDRVKRVPAPYGDEHPRADLLRRTRFQVRFVEPLPDSIDTPAFAGWCASRLDALMPVHRWLLTNLT